MKWSDYRHIIQSTCCPVAAKLQINLFLLVLVIWGAPLLLHCFSGEILVSVGTFSATLDAVSFQVTDFFFFLKEVVWDRILLCSPPAYTSDAIGHWPALSLCPLTWSPEWSLASPAQEKPSPLLREQSPDALQCQEELGSRAVPSLWEALGGSELLLGFTFVFLTRPSKILFFQKSFLIFSLRPFCKLCWVVVTSFRSPDAFWVCLHRREETLSQHTIYAIGVLGHFLLRD